MVGFPNRRIVGHRGTRVCVRKFFTDQDVIENVVTSGWLLHYVDKIQIRAQTVCFEVVEVTRNDKFVVLVFHQDVVSNVDYLVSDVA